jgi:amino acid transporter
VNSVLDLFGWLPLGGSLTLGAVFVILASVKGLQKLMLMIAMLSMVSVTIGTACYIVFYEQTYDEGGNDECQRQDRAQSSRPSGPSVENHADGHTSAAGKHVKVDEQPQGDGSALAIACKGNAIMRASLHTQVIATVGGLAAATMGIVAAFVTVIGYIGSDRKRGMTLGGDGNDGGAAAQHQDETEVPLGSQPRHSFLLSDLLVILTGLVIHALLGRAWSGRGAGREHG